MLINYLYYKLLIDFPGGSVVKNLPANIGDTGLIPGEGNGNPLQYLGNPMDRGASWLQSMGSQRVGRFGD